MSVRSTTADADGTSVASAPSIEVLPGPSLQSRVLRAALQVTVRPVLQTWGALPNLPWPYRSIDFAGALLRPIDGTVVGSRRLTNCAAEWIRGPGAESDRVLLYLHGGAFVCCGMRTHRRLVSEISKVCEAPALNVDYRMLPGAPISESVEDCIDGYRLLLDLGYRNDQIVVVGDSAGGYLALMTAIVAAERGLGGPAAIVCQSPFIDTDPGRKLERLGDVRDPLFPANALMSLADLMTRVEAEDGQLDPNGRVRRPLDADLSGLPPVLIQAGADELLVVDAELIAAEIASQGADCTLQLFEGQFHVFQAAADLVPESRRAIRMIGEFVRDRVPAHAR